MLPEKELSRLLSAVSVAEEYFFTPLAILARRNETKKKMGGPVQRFAGSDYFSFDKILQQTSFKPQPEQQTRRLRTRRAKTVANNNTTPNKSSSSSSSCSSQNDTPIAKDPVETDIRMYEMHLNWNNLYEKERYIWDTEIERIGREGMEEARRVFESLDEHNRGLVPRRLLRNLVSIYALSSYSLTYNHTQHNKQVPVGFEQNGEKPIGDRGDGIGDENNAETDDEMVRFEEFVRFYFDLLNAKPSKKLNVDFDTNARGMLAYYRTHLNTFLRDPQNTQDMRDAQRETGSARTFENGEFMGTTRTRRVFSALFKGRGENVATRSKVDHTRMEG